MIRCAGEAVATVVCITTYATAFGTGHVVAVFLAQGLGKLLPVTREVEVLLMLMYSLWKIISV